MRLIIASTELILVCVAELLVESVVNTTFGETQNSLLSFDIPQRIAMSELRSQLRVG